MGLPEDFQEAAVFAKTFTVLPTNDELLKLYALFKQGSVGDRNTPKPSKIDLKAVYKWNAWGEQRGKSSDAAMSDYIKLVRDLAVNYKK